MARVSGDLCLRLLFLPILANFLLWDRMELLLIAVIVASKLQQLMATPIQNGVVGYPQVTCGQHSIMVEVQTEKPFSGRLFVKGEAHLKECSKAFPLPQGPYGTPPQPYGQPVTSTSYYYPQPAPSQPQGYGGRPARSYGRDPPAYEQRLPERVAFEVAIEQCHLRRQRTLVPRGVEYTFTLVTSFHPSFVTKVDRAYRVKCFYMEAEKQANSVLDVSMIPTTEINEQFPMPQCQYHVKTGGPDGPDARFARVGEQIYHVWTCDRTASWIYGMLVKNCYVDDGQGNKFLLINDQGCALDKHLVGDLTYDSQYLAAYVESHVFKYADKPTLYFSCTIELCYKADGGCAGKNPPQCAAPVYPPEPTNVGYPSAQPVYPPSYAAAPSALPPTSQSYGSPQAAFYNDPNYNHNQPSPTYHSYNTPPSQYSSYNSQPQEPAPGPYPFNNDVPIFDEQLVHTNVSNHTLKAKRNTVKPVSHRSQLESDAHQRSFEADFVANPVVVLPFEEQSELYDNQDLPLNDTTVVWPSHLAIVGGNKSPFPASYCVSAVGFGLTLALFLLLFLFSSFLSFVMLKRLFQTRQTTKA